MPDDVHSTSEFEFAAKPDFVSFRLQLSHEAVGKQRKQILQMFQKVQQKSPSVQKSLNNLQGRWVAIKKKKTATVFLFF